MKENRLQYMINVACKWIRINAGYMGSETIFYDEAECDGFCVADDLENSILEVSYQINTDLLNSLQEVVDYYEDMKPVLNDELQAMLNRVEKAIRKAT